MTATHSEVPAELGRELLRQMLRVRRFEERCAELYSATKIRGFVHLYIGEEAVAVGAVPLLRADDALFTTYREHAHALVRGVPMPQVMAEMFGKVEGCSRGRGGSMHLFDAERRLFGGNAIVAAGLPQAVGMALADHMLGRDSVTACFFGEGAMAEGEFHESINLAALWHLPVVFVCENNLYAMGTALERSESETNLPLKAAAYEVPSWSVDGMDVLAVREAAQRAVSLVRESGGPVFLEAKTFRFRAHSMYDPDRYRDKAEIESWRHRDPLVLLTDRLEADGALTSEQAADIEAGVRAEIDDAVAFAGAGSDEPVEDLLRFVYTEPDSPARTGRGS
jgi:pyruvate dehydrogenase E1 component alpha subunit